MSIMAHQILESILNVGILKEDIIFASNWSLPHFLIIEIWLKCAMLRASLNAYSYWLPSMCLTAWVNLSAFCPYFPANQRTGSLWSLVKPNFFHSEFQSIRLLNIKIAFFEQLNHAFASGLYFVHTSSLN